MLILNGRLSSRRLQILEIWKSRLTAVLAILASRSIALGLFLIKAGGAKHTHYNDGGIFMLRHKSADAGGAFADTLQWDSFLLELRKYWRELFIITLMVKTYPRYKIDFWRQSCNLAKLCIITQTTGGQFGVWSSEQTPFTRHFPYFGGIYAKREAASL